MEAEAEKNALSDGSAPWRIVFVSRLDADCSLGANLLCEIAPKIHQFHPNTEIIIVGGGSEYPEILRKSAQINRKINRELIKVVALVRLRFCFLTASRH